MAKQLELDIENIPEQDFQDVWNAIHDGAETPAEAFGFDEASMVSLERMALGYYRATRYGAAALIYAFLLRLDRKRHSAWRGLGASAMVLREYEKARTCFELAAEYGDGDPIARVFLGECLCHMGQKDKGLAVLKEVADAGSDDPAVIPYITRARAIIGADGGTPHHIVLKRMGEQLVEDSEEDMQAFFDNINLDEPPLEFDEDAEIQWEDIKRNPQLMGAIKDLKQMVADGRLTLADIGGFTENELDGAYAVACKMVESNQLTPAMQLLGYLIFIDPYKAKYHQLVGIILQRMEQFEAADQYYSVAEALEPEDPMTKVYRGEAQLMCGNVDEGLTSVRQGLELAGQAPNQHKDLIARGNTLIKQFSA